MATKARAAVQDVPGVFLVEDRQAVFGVQAFSVGLAAGAAVPDWRHHLPDALGITAAVAEREAVVMLQAQRAAFAQRDPDLRASLRADAALLRRHLGPVRAQQLLFDRLLALDARRAGNGPRAWDPRLDRVVAIAQELRAWVDASSDPVTPTTTVATDPFGPAVFVGVDPNAPRYPLGAAIAQLQRSATPPEQEAAVSAAWSRLRTGEPCVVVRLSLLQARDELLAAAAHLRQVGARGRDPTVNGRYLDLARECAELVEAIDLVGAPL